MPHPHRPQAVQQFVGAAGFAPVVGRIRHLHRRLFARIVGQRAAEPQVLVVRVGGQHQQVRPPQGGCHTCTRAGSVPCPSLHLAQNRPPRAEQAPPGIPGVPGRVFVQKPVLAAGFPAAVLVNEGPSGGAIEDQVKPANPSLLRTSTVPFPEKLHLLHAAVREPFGTISAGPRTSSSICPASPCRPAATAGAQNAVSAASSRHTPRFPGFPPPITLYYKERCGPAFLCVYLHFRVLSCGAIKKAYGGGRAFAL